MAALKNTLSLLAAFAAVGFASCTKQGTAKQEQISQEPIAALHPRDSIIITPDSQIVHLMHDNTKDAHRAQAKTNTQAPMFTAYE